ncbi:DUF262 domain-containing HNH endonuclease family protein [Alteromonas sp. 1_MG-2023]|uniref:DUF262 domain-containing protein n=1 Tax=Alteromonas sp. 1_MG-2023 TaxID=3062669 RepID=UPI0026E37A5E|nr:DUF262 domain-containing HNH endonuclease family protein [Alteromonas sp. 1_MG-2023]MDO6566500.1 DUF262 domain-containing HNH endonuclease family protein [Alteromonas sp. 1_MG-2023]
MDITPKSESLEKILTGLETNFYVPDYQRDYSWTSDEVETLWIDLKNAFKNKTDYFMGTVVLKEHSESEEKFDIVDGQQRLATFSILFSVFNIIGCRFHLQLDLLPDVARNEHNKKFAEKMRNIAIQRLREASEPDNYFLHLNKKDSPSFRGIIESDGPLLITDEDLKIVKNESRLIKTKKIFIKKILNDFKGADSIEQLYSFLVHIVKKLRFISIRVKTDYEAFLLFESLNSKGMDLSVADLVKNKILMHANGASSAELLDNWEEMMRSIESSRVSPVDFLRIYWDAIRGINTTKKELYKFICHYIESLPATKTAVEQFSLDIKDKAESLSSFANSRLIFPDCIQNSNKALKYCGEINQLRYATCYPVLLYAFSNREDLIDKLAELSLSFLFRWITVGDYSVGGAKAVFDEVLKLLNDPSKTEPDIIAPFFKHEDKVGDIAFQSSFKQLKLQDNALAKYIVSKVYLYSNKAQAIPNYSEIHLEHVLPQVSKRWEAAGFTIPEGTLIKDWVYHIGNMVLLDKTINTKIKNSVFKVKFPEYKGSPFPDTNMIYNVATSGRDWSPEWIIERADEISKSVSDIWPLKKN